MTVLVSIETVLLVLLLVLVVGLLRSHAELLRRLGPAPEAGPLTTTAAAPPLGARRDPGVPAPSLSGTTPAGDAVSLSFEGGAGAPTLLAFLTSGCSTCAGFWDELAGHSLPGGVQTVIVTHGAEREQPARLRKLAPNGIPVVMSSPAWEQYAVPGAPYFVLVDGSVRGEGVATSWQALSSLVGDAIEDERLAANAGGGPNRAGGGSNRAGGGSNRAGSGSNRARGVDETLAAAGIGPDHPSLYPAGREQP